jgi:mono/diheme cytochrome c family protein
LRRPPFRQTLGPRRFPDGIVSHRLRLDSPRPALMRNKWLRRLATAVGALVTLLAAFAATVWIVSSRQLARTLSIPATPFVAAPRDSAVLARGYHLAEVIGKCSECHGADLGGQVFIDDPGLGRVVAANLTPGGPVASWSDGELVRAIRHGVSRDGRQLLVMPSEDFAAFSDEDAAALIAYLRSRPAVTRDLPAHSLKFLARALMVTGQLPIISAEKIDHARPSAAHVDAGPTPGYGKYLADVGGCTGCHGPGLSGGKIPGTPPDWKPAANLTPTGIGRWTEADFFRALREGRRPAGTPIDSIMPWKRTARMTDDEIRAVWLYLKTVPPRQFGTR